MTEHRALEQAARAASAQDNDDRIATDLHDRVIGHLFGCGLTLASVLGRNKLDDHITEQLYDVIDELDTARHEDNPGTTKSARAASQERAQIASLWDGYARPRGSTNRLTRASGNVPRAAN